MISEASARSPPWPKSLARACLFCRARKIRCDTARPRCAACVIQKRECTYKVGTPNPRPTLAQVHELKQQKRALEQVIVGLKNVPQAAVPNNTCVPLPDEARDIGQRPEMEPSPSHIQCDNSVMDNT
ncbi:hypothetical protein FOPG_17186 [Fusarium oxysporum f. sp. conglutinans race 2 54008]|uniref:Zn(2)-C6 fungal-type domain-containing protein n=1 Tax=Fusarium oxysporum f. sp. conglutinans race 2 54008 TaxID=1089457 RepID=X0I000_FUSOX|nr:hypothetical protein FOPG_17186 [Fusarium oxysporum f. sp. conglutinans race 2 54008]